MIWYAALILLAITLISFYASGYRAIKTVGGRTEELHSLPSYHGLYAAFLTVFVGFGILFAANTGLKYFSEGISYKSLPEAIKKLDKIKQDHFIDQAKKIAAGEGRFVAKAETEELQAARQKLADDYNAEKQSREVIATVLAFLSALTVFFITFIRISPNSRARNRSETIIYVLLLACAIVAILTTVGILGSLITETYKFFAHVPIYKFLFGTKWSPLQGVFEGKVDENFVGAIPLFAGTFMIALIAMLVAVPIGLMAAIYLSDYASQRVRTWCKPILEILAGIPTVVYGFFAAITVAPFIRSIGESMGMDVSSESVLVAGLVMGIMIIPFISSLSDDVISAVPNALRDGSYGIGATKAETITKVVLPAALPGIVSAVLLGFSRAVGETMIVVMAAGTGPNLTWNPLEAMTTVTVQIVTLITGDAEAETAAGPAFALGFTLLAITLMFNIVALRIVQKYRQRYE
ncbi:MAG: phosphate ABC transporter permease subunit PstC [Methyloligellaceae bacterium]